MKLTTIADLRTEENKALLLEVRHNLSEIFNDFLEEDHDDHVRTPGVHASELCSCRRQVVYSITGMEKVKVSPVEMKKRFLVGQALHDMLQGQFALLAKTTKTVKIDFQKEAKTRDTELGRKYDIQSSCDGIFTIYENGGKEPTPLLRIGLEIKSASPDSYASLKEPMAKHVEQGTVYQACLDLPFMWYLYWNKGNQNYTPMREPWLKPFNSLLWAKLERRAKESLEDADKGTLPDREEGHHCSWCPYAHVCKPTSRAGGWQPNRNVRPITTRR